jgi:hypothetical protein
MLRTLLTPQTTYWQYTTGVKDTSLVSPEGFQGRIPGNADRHPFDSSQRSIDAACCEARAVPSSVAQCSFTRGERDLPCGWGTDAKPLVRGGLRYAGDLRADGSAGALWICWYLTCSGPQLSCAIHQWNSNSDNNQRCCATDHCLRDRRQLHGVPP